MKLKIYYRDTDCGGVVYYAKYLEYFEIARTEFLKQRGIDINELMNKGIYFVVVSTNIKYFFPARYGDILKINTNITLKTRTRIEFSYTVENKNTSKLIVTGKTLLACVDKNFKIRKLPEVFNDL